MWGGGGGGGGEGISTSAQKLQLGVNHAEVLGDAEFFAHGVVDFAVGEAGALVLE